MSKKSRLLERQKKNKIARLIESGDKGEIVNEQLAGAVGHLNEIQEAYYKEVMPLVQAGLKDSKVYYLVPLLEVHKIDNIKGRWVIHSTQQLDTKQFKAGEKVSQSLKSILDVDGVAVFANEQGKVFMPNVEKVVIEKEITKTVSTGIKQKDIEKAIDKTLHQYKTSYQYEANKRLFDEFLANLG